MEKTKLNKTLIYNKDSNIDTEIMDLRRRLNIIEQEVSKPQAIGGRGKIEEEKIIKDLINGMADFESDIKDIRKMLTEHDTDIQDTAKLIHVLDQQGIKDKETFDIILRRLDTLELLKDTFAKDKVEYRKSIDDLRLACESEFNAVKKAEINDVNNLNAKINNLIAIQDVVEHLANKMNQIEQEVEGVRFERKVSPIKITNKVPADNITSSMAPTTKLMTDLKGRKSNTVTFDENVNSNKSLRNDGNRRSPSGDLSERRDKFQSPDAKARDSNPARTSFGRLYTDSIGAKNTDYVKIDDEIVHKDDLKYKLRGDDKNASTPNKLTLKDLMKNSVLPESYKVNRINEDANNRGRSKDNASRRDRNKDSSASKYTYSKQKEVNKLASGGSTKALKKSPERIQQKRSKGRDDDEVSDGEIDGNITHDSVMDKVSRLNKNDRPSKLLK